MKVFHYSLGFPPYRTGGMTKFCMDLMHEQKKEGHDVYLMWPSVMHLLNRKNSIRIKEPVDGIGNIEIINPVPISYDEGILDVKRFTEIGDKEEYARLFEAYKPDVIHIHTLMGLHKSMLDAANEAGIRLVYTTHDFFPICPRVTLFINGAKCENYLTCSDCPQCNIRALSMKKIVMLQSPVYRRFKDSQVVKVLRKKHRKTALSSEEELITCNDVSSCAVDYITLRNHFFSMLKQMDMIHYNSSVTKSVYETVFKFSNSRVISITHADIAAKKRIKEFNSDFLRIRYLGPQGEAKGYYLLIEALDMLWSETHQFRLDVHFTPQDVPAYMHCHDKYQYSELESIFDDTDILVCPSKWNETFGFTVLEALSYGVPVILSGNVGAKDIVGDGCGMIVDDITPNKLYCTIRSIDQVTLREMNHLICCKQEIETIDIMCRRIISECYCYSKGTN